MSERTTSELHPAPQSLNPIKPLVIWVVLGVFFLFVFLLMHIKFDLILWSVLKS